jgi:hypothetical protein
MAKKRRLNVSFPLGGLDRHGAYRQQRPFTTPSALNVRPMASLEGRERGGSRPGLVESHIDALDDSVRMLYPMSLALGDGFTAWSDTFSGLSLANAWSQASWASDVPSILPSSLASIDTSVDDAAVVRSVLPIDTSEDYTVEMYIVPWCGGHHGVYRLYLRLDDTTPAIETDGVVIELTLTGSTGTYSGTMTTYSSGTPTEYALASGTLSAPRAGWLSASVSGDTVTVYWCGVTLATHSVDSHSGTRVGFGMECTEDGGLCLVNTFRTQYYSTGTVESLRTVLIASAGGKLYKEGPYGRMTEVSTSLTLRDDVPLSAAQIGQNLIIADYGDVRAEGTDGTTSGTTFDATGVSDWTALGIQKNDDVVVISNAQGGAVDGTYQIASVAAGSLTLASTAGTGTCAYRIERAPKIFDPSTDTLSILESTAGQVPTGCPIVCRYFGSIYFGGAEIAPHVWYKSRQNDETDWDYSQEDSQRAVAGTSSEAGVPGGPITAMIPHSDDYLIMGCLHSIWRMRGDPAYGGQLDALSHTVGIIEQNAGCLGPAGELVFLSLDGVYILPPGGESFPQSMSREVLPGELKNINPNVVDISMEYDTTGRGVHLYITPDSPNSGIHWWIDWERKTFWPLSLNADHEPTAICILEATAIEDSGVILGGRDGILRRPSELSSNDCGEAVSSYVKLGPIGLASDSNVGVIVAIDAVMASESGDVDWELAASNTFEGAISASADSSGTWSEGLNAREHPAGRGQAFVLKLSNGEDAAWAMEHIIVDIQDAGRRRI